MPSEGETSGGGPQNPLRNLPAVHEVLAAPQLASWLQRLSRTTVVRAVRQTLAELRAEIRAASEPAAAQTNVERIVERVDLKLHRLEQPRLRPVINATGIILHTGLGRAPLADAAVQRLTQVARSYCSLELELDSGRRGKRTDLVRELLRELTGAESATVVNNNAAATLIALATIAAGKEVIVSRGELIEIGGSFRLPEIMAASGAILREVGTTNKTRLSDYETAIGEQTAAIMKVHKSNYRIVGFAESVPLAELVPLARQHNLTLIDDIGSGALIDYGQFGFAGEPVAARSIEAGADLVLFSADKLLGGPQAGVIAGRRELIERIERHPLARACRVCKLTLAALEATLQLYLDQPRLAETLPVLALLNTSVEELNDRAQRLIQQLEAVPELQLSIAPDTTYLGGGSVPQQALPTVTLRLRSSRLSEAEFARRLRTGSPPVIARVHEEAVVIDLRTVFEDQLDELAEAVRAAAAPPL